MSKQTKATTATKPAIVVTGDLLAIAKKVGTAIKAVDKTAVVLGDLARQAIPHIASEELLAAFVAECKKQCGTASEASVKVYLSQVRGVIRAALKGWELPAEDSIKALYKEAPKGNGANAGGGKPRTIKTETRETAPAKATMAPADVAAMAVKLPVSDKLTTAARMLFGHCDDSIIAALEWVASNESALLRFVEEQVSAAAAPAAKRTRVRKAA